MEGGNIRTAFQKSMPFGILFWGSWSATPHLPEAGCTSILHQGNVTSAQQGLRLQLYPPIWQQGDMMRWGKEGYISISLPPPMSCPGRSWPITFTQHQYDWKWRVRQGPSALYLPQPLVSGEPSWEPYIYTFFTVWPNAVMWIRASLYPSSHPSPTKWAGPSGEVSWAPIPGVS